MCHQNRIACLFFLLLAPGFLTTVYTRAYNALHLELFAFLGWGGVAILGGLGLLKAKQGRISASSITFAAFLFVMPAIVILLQQVFGITVPYFGMVVIAVYYLLVSACIFLLGSLAVTWFRNLPATSNTGIDMATSAMKALIGVATASALVGVAQYLQLPLSETFVTPATQMGTAYGNLRQPNMFALLCVLGLISLIALRGTAHSLQKQSIALAALLFLTLVLGVVLSASRAGALLVGMIFLWGLLEAWRYAKPNRMLLMALPLYLSLRYVAVQLALEGFIPFSGAQKQSLINTALEGDYWRQVIWLKSWALIQTHPLWGVGFGNLAYAMFTETLPVRMAAVTEHAHNIFLQLAAELGLPVAIAWTLVLAALMVRSRRAIKTFEGRAAAAFLLAILIHSLLEYPLWYAYFLLPFAFTLGVFAQLGEVERTDDEYPAALMRPATSLVIGGVLTVVLAIFGLWDYAKVSPSYALNSTLPLSDRVIQSYKSVLFLNLADYSALNLTPIAPATADVQLRLASRVAYFRADPQVIAAHAAAASLVGQMTLAKALAYRLWLKDKDAANKLRLALLVSGLRPAVELAAFLSEPTFIPWPLNNLAVH